MTLQTLIAAWHQQTAPARYGRIPALDGLRFLMVFSVVAFHLWQQSWLTPTFTVFGRFVSMDPWLRTGYLWVDGMLLLSGFLLFLPLARAREAGRAASLFKGFYTRRVKRIVPTYWLNLLVVFLVVALPEQRYATSWAAARDWLAHLSFTHPLFQFSSVHTPLNGVLWTLGVEMQFYLIFPFFARAFYRMPLFTYLAGSAIAFLFRAYAMTIPQTPMLLNQLPAFLDVYLNGMLAAMVYARLEKQTRDDGLNRVFMTAVLAAGLVGLAVLVRAQAGQRSVVDIRVGQMSIRFLQSALTSLVLLGASLGLGGIRLVLGNRVMAWFAAISYQVYIWHQVIAIQLKKWRFPPSMADNPHMTGERPWQVAYVLVALGLTLLISTGITYLIEQPLSGMGTIKKKT